jgi:hypothetical protein
MSGRLKLLFDLSSAQPLRWGAHGAGEYAKSVFRSLAARAPDGVAAFIFDGMGLDEDTTHAAEEAGIEMCTVGGQSGLQQLIRARAPERFYSALPYGLGRLDYGRAEFVGTIHGLRPIETPADSVAWRYSRNASDVFKAQMRLAGRRWYVQWMRNKFASLVQVRAASRHFVVPSEYTAPHFCASFLGQLRSRFKFSTARRQ